MAAKYTPIIEPEMETQLKTISKRFRRVDLSNTFEIVYSLRAQDNDRLTIRVYSSIDKATKTTRPEGKDAIRVCLCYNGKVILTSKRINRTQNWQNKLRLRVTSMARIKDKVKCPRCNNYMRERKNKKTGEKFLGCLTYPKCNMMKKIPTELINN